MTTDPVSGYITCARCGERNAPELAVELPDRRMLVARCWSCGETYDRLDLEACLREPAIRRALGRLTCPDPDRDKETNPC